MVSRKIILVLVSLLHLLDPTSAQAGFGNYNSTCTPTAIDYDCDASRGFRCDRETSRCLCYNQNQMGYNEETDKCEPYLGGICYIMDGNLDYLMLKCKDPNADCITGRYVTSECVCKDTHIPSDDSDVITPEKKCLPTYGFTCDTENFPCHQSTKLSCTNNVCQCEHPLSQVFDEKKKMCVGMVDTKNSCDPASASLQCGSHAECGNDGQCHCAAGWSADFSLPGQCKLHHGQACSVGECNSDRGLECLAGICQCKLAPDVAFDENKQICAVKEGYSCSLQNEVLEVKGTRTLVTCMTGLTCVQNGANPQFGVCDVSKY